jgi:hypothetical protein
MAIFASSTEGIIYVNAMADWSKGSNALVATEVSAPKHIALISVGASQGYTF